MGRVVPQFLSRRESEDSTQAALGMVHAPPSTPGMGGGGDAEVKADGGGGGGAGAAPAPAAGGGAPRSVVLKPRQEAPPPTPPGSTNANGPFAGILSGTSTPASKRMGLARQKSSGIFDNLAYPDVRD